MKIYYKMYQLVHVPKIKSTTLIYKGLTKRPEDYYETGVPIVAITSEETHDWHVKIKASSWISFKQRKL